MGHIKEPKGIDFIIQSEPLTDKEKMEISQFIANYKAKNNSTRTKATIRKTKVKV